MADNIIGEAFIAIKASMDEFKKEAGKIQSEVQNSLKPVQEKMKSIGTSMTDTGKKLTKGLTVPVVAAGGALLGLGQKFDDAVDAIRIGTGATGKALEGLEQDFRAVYESVPTSMEEASMAIADLNTRLGLTGKPLQDLSKQVLNLSRITGTDLSAVIQTSTRLFGDWGVAAQDQSKALDTVFKVSQATGIGVDRLVGLLVQFGGPLRQMGFSLDEAAVMMGKFEKEGVNTELVVGSLRIALSKMAKEGIKDPAKALDIMIQKIKDAGSAGEANALALEMFGARAGPDMAAAVREGRLDLDELLKTIQSSPETINGAAAATDGFAEKMTLFKNKLSTALEPLGTTLLNALDNAMPALEKIIGVISKVVEWFGNLDPSIQTTIITIMGLVTALGPVMTAIGTIIKPISMIVGIFSKMSGIIGVVQTAFTALTGPIGLVVLAIGAAITIGFLLVKNWNQISAWLSGIWGGIKNVATTVWNGIAAFFTGVWNSIKAVVTAVWNFISGFLSAIWNGIATLTKAVWNGIAAFFTAIWNGIKAVASAVWEGIKVVIITPINALKVMLTAVWNSIETFVIGLWNGLKVTAGAVWNGIKTAVITPINAAKNLITSVWNSISSFLGKTWEGIKNTAGRIWNGIVAVIKSPINGIIKAINGMIRGLNKIHFDIPKWVPGLGGKSFGFNLPTIPMLAEGGKIRAPGLAMVGEAGPELLSLPRGAVVSPLDEESAGFGSNVTNIYNIYPQQLVTEADVRRLRQSIQNVATEDLFRAVVRHV